MDDYGLETVQEYMYHIRSNAEMSVRNLLRDVAKRAGTNVLSAIDYLDDGSPVRQRYNILCLLKMYSMTDRSVYASKSTKKKALPFSTSQELAARFEAISTRLYLLFIRRSSTACDRCWILTFH